MSQGIGTSDRTKVVGTAGKAVETTAEADRTALTTRDRTAEDLLQAILGQLVTLTTLIQNIAEE